jgi:hypothetical protein
MIQIRGRSYKRYKDDHKKVKKCNIILPLAIIAFFGFLEAYHKINLNQWNFLKDPILLVEKGYMFLSIHYEKLCFSKPHCPTTRAPKKLRYNYITTKTWKYG